MATEVTRVVDAHVHLWDPARTDWYPFLSSGGQELNMGDISGMVAGNLNGPMMAMASRAAETILAAR